MRNRQRCESNRKHRLINLAGELCVLQGEKRWKAIKRLRASNDYLRATRVTRGIVDELIDMWMKGESIGNNAGSESSSGDGAGG